MNVKQYDAIIVGAGLSGLVAAYTLASYGVRCCVVEKSNSIGGGNKSFTNSEGDIFDSGYHALDYKRSLVTSNLFKMAVKGEVVESTLRRGLIIDGFLFNYNEKAENWPDSLKKILHVPKVDDLEGDITQSKLADLYGREYINFCIKNILQSYPSETRAIKEGRPESNSLGFIYPWFFPNVQKNISDDAKEWEKFHGSMRQQRHNIIYPKNGGFDSFMQGLLDSINKEYCDVFLGCEDVNVELDAGQKCQGVSFNGASVEAKSYYWCAPFFGLASMLSLPLPKGVPQTLVLGSFRLNTQLDSRYHEILVGDKNAKINRISFPGLLREKENNLVQIEFIYPSDELDMDEEQWKTHWIDYLSKIGVLFKEDIISFRFDSMPKGMVTSLPLDDISRKYRKLIEDTETDIRVPSVNAGPENINRIVPEVIENVVKSIL